MKNRKKYLVIIGLWLYAASALASCCAGQKAVTVDEVANAIIWYSSPTQEHPAQQSLNIIRKYLNANGDPNALSKRFSLLGMAIFTCSGDDLILIKSLVNAGADVEMNTGFNSSSAFQLSTQPLVKMSCPSLENFLQKAQEAVAKEHAMESTEIKQAQERVEVVE
jgi:hypothetical protein